MQVISDKRFSFSNTTLKCNYTPKTTWALQKRLVCLVPKIHIFRRHSRPTTGQVMVIYDAEKLFNCESSIAN